LRTSIIIPTLNEAAHLGAALASAKAAGADEMIVVDGGSSDGTCELVDVARLLSSSPGRALQQNAGAAEATGDVLLFLHADCQLSAQSLEQLKAAVDAGALWGGFQQRIDAPSVSYRLIERGNALRVRWRGLVYGDQGLWVQRSLFERVGGFENVPLLEDLLLSRRLRRIARPHVLPGPLTISARRWQRHGVVRQTLRNWSILAAHACGASPASLARRYRRHDS
jgi:rSAM/selenodomain-associated transferase 2